jgi:hypothetical protein
MRPAFRIALVCLAMSRVASAATLNYEAILTGTTGPNTTSLPTLTFAYDEETELFSDVIFGWEGAPRFPYDITTEFNNPCQTNQKFCIGDMTQLFAVLTGGMGPVTWATRLVYDERALTIATEGFQFVYLQPGHGGDSPNLSASGTLVTVPTPEPSSLALLALAGLLFARRH